MQKIYSAMNATISADIISSTALSTNSLTLLQAELSNLMQLLEDKYGRDDFWGRLIKGDSIECFIRNPQNALRIALLIKSLVKKSAVCADDSHTQDKGNKRFELFKTYGVRVAVGIGEMRLVDRTSDMMDGEAIYASGRALENQSTSQKSKIIIKNTMFFVSKDVLLSEQMNAFLALADMLFKKSRESQCEVIYYRLLGYSENEIADKLHINQSSVNQRSTSFGWNAIEQFLNYYEKLTF